MCANEYGPVNDLGAVAWRSVAGKLSKKKGQTWSTTKRDKAGQQDEQSNHLLPWVVTILALIALGVSYAMGWTVAFLLCQVVVISIVIWQACDPFADAAQWIGTTLRVPGSVRGATLDAVASSMPEFWSGVFFVWIAFTAAGDSAAERIHAGGEGFGATIATCAGSAVYNMILIPAFVALVIAVKRKERPDCRCRTRSDPA